MKTDQEKKRLFARFPQGTNPKAAPCCSKGGEEEDSDRTVSIDGLAVPCGCSSDGAVKQHPKKRQITIDFLFLDLNVCTRCQGTEKRLDEALGEVARVLQATGVAVTVHKINVWNKDLAIQYHFISSPTIRVDGRDIQLEVKESLCESCGDLCADDVDCRVWTYQGRDYNIPPKGMIIEGLLREIYGGGTTQGEERSYTLPDNLARFYNAMDRKQSKAETGRAKGAPESRGCC